MIRCRRCHRGGRWQEQCLEGDEICLLSEAETVAQRQCWAQAVRSPPRFPHSGQVFRGCGQNLGAKRVFLPHSHGIADRQGSHGHIRRPARAYFGTTDLRQKR
jgi:hypothetical protein